MRIKLPQPQEFALLLEKTLNIHLDIMPFGIATDNREIEQGDLFLALPGEKVDGHQFVESSFKAGAVAALVTQTVETDAKGQQIKVSSVTGAMGRVAHQWRKKFSIPVVGITGSNGKTTTKELLKHYCAKNGKPHATTGNFNTSIGLPLTLLTLTREHTVSILEMGASQPGDIEFLANIAEPTHGLITNVAPAHLEGFGSVKGVLDEKAKLLTYKRLKTAFLNLSDPNCATLSLSTGTKTFGFDIPADFCGSAGKDDTKPEMSINEHRIPLPNPNPALQKNVLAAASIAITLGIGWPVIQESTIHFKPISGRSEVRKIHGMTIIDDTYNANLESTRTALDFLARFTSRGRKIFIFGDMFELGESAVEAHAQVGQACLETLPDTVFTVGELSAQTTEVASAKIPSFHFQTKEQLTDKLLQFCKPGDTLLVKGSRGMAMETIIQGLETA